MFEFGMFRPSTKSKRKSRPLFLMVETLETREVPAALTLGTQVLPGHEVQLSGTLSNQIAGATVTFSGAATGSATTDAKGNYSFTTNDGSLGTVYAIASLKGTPITVDVAADIAVANPTITLGVTDMTADTITLSGALTDMDAADQTLTISGANPGAVVTDANGNFSFTLFRADAGTVDVSETDLWGETSNIAQVNAAAPAPFIRNFVAIDEGLNIWLFQGNVFGNNVAGLTITFGGLNSLSGQSTTVNTDGSFSFTQTLAAGESGQASAQTVQNGTSSNVVYANVLSGMVSLTNPGTQIEFDDGVVKLPLSATDAANNALTFTAANLPTGLSMDSTTGDISGVVAADADQNGPYAVTVTAIDSTACCGASTTFMMNVKWVNQAPSFTANDPPAVNANVDPSGECVSVPSWATFNPGAADESGQTATYIVTNVSNPGLFLQAPAIDANGNLTYTVAPYMSGTSTFDVQVQDNGGTANGGCDTSAAVTFTIAVQDQK